MREQARIKRILKLIEKMWLDSPDERFGQFLINRGVIPDDMRVWIREDDELERGLEKYIFNNGKKDNKDKKIKAKKEVKNVR